MSVAGVNELALAWVELLWKAAWQGGLALAAVWVVCRAVRRIPAHVQCWLWRLAFVKLLMAGVWIVPVELRWLPPVEKAAVEVSPVAASELSRPGVDSFPVPRPLRSGRGTFDSSTVHRASAPRLGAWSWLLFAWITGVLLSLVNLFRHWGRVRRMVARLTPVTDEGVRQSLGAACRQMGVRRLPELRMSNDSGSPYLVGVRRSVIVLPAVVLDSGAADVARAALAHEVAHIRRRDLAWNLLPALAETLFFFHPLVRLARREWRLAQEIATDELAVSASQMDVAGYARMLVELVARCPAAAVGPHLAVTVSETYSQLERRMIAMQTFRTLTRGRRIALAAAVVAIAVCGLAPWKLTARAAAESESLEAADINDGPASADPEADDEKATAAEDAAARLVKAALENVGQRDDADRAEVAAKLLNELAERIADQEKAAAEAGVSLAVTIVKPSRGAASGPIFRITFENSGDKDVVLNLGIMLANGKKQYSTEVRLLLTGPDAKTKELRFQGPNVAGRVDDFLVPLAAGSTYSVRVGLERFWCPDTNEFQLKLEPGQYGVRAQLTSKPAAHVNQDTAGLALINLLTGKFESEAARFRIGESGEVLGAGTGDVPGVPLARERALVSSIQALGGEIVFDETSLNKPVILVSFFRKSVSDADLPSLKQLIDLRALTLDGTQITDDALINVKGVKGLAALDLNSTAVSDKGLEHLKDLTRLESLGLIDTRVTDEGLAHLKGMTRLVMLLLGNTKVDDRGLPHLTGLAALVTLDLSGTKVKSELGPLSSLTRLRDLRLNNTKITDAALANVAELTGLETLVLNSTPITDTGLVHLKKLKNLQSLWLPDTRIGDEGLVHLKDMTALRTLVLSKTSVTDKGLEHLYGLTGLKSLDLSNTKVTDEGIRKLQSALPDCGVIRLGSAGEFRLPQRSPTRR